MLCRLGNFDPSALRRSFEAKNADRSTVKRIAAALDYNTYAQHVLCHELSYSAALMKTEKAITDVLRYNDATPKEHEDRHIRLISRLFSFSPEQAIECGRRLILAENGLDDLYRRHRFKDVRLDVICEVFKDELDESTVQERQPETLLKHHMTLHTSFNAMGVSIADQKRIFKILEAHDPLTSFFEALDRSEGVENLPGAPRTGVAVPWCEDPIQAYRLAEELERVMAQMAKKQGGQKYR